MEVKVLVDAKSGLGESPAWDERSQRLYWTDMLEGMIFSCAADGRDVTIWKLPQTIGSLCLRERGGAILSLADGIYLFDFGTGALDLVSNLEPELPTRLNDSKVDRQGRLVTGSIDERLVDPASQWLAGIVEPASGLYRVDADLSVSSVAPGIGISNGVGFSPDGKTLYCGDSWADLIYAFDYDLTTGEASNRRVFASFVDDKGFTGKGQPDGLTVDDEGYLWDVVVYGGELRRYAPDGSLDRRIPMPLINVTSCCFGGPDYDILFVTSMSNPDLPMNIPIDNRMAGSVLAIRGLGARGIPETRFKG